jgi:quercetin dioxygenase-like cupin family protein
VFILGRSLSHNLDLGKAKIVSTLWTIWINLTLFMSSSIMQADLEVGRKIVAVSEKESKIVELSVERWGENAPPTPEELRQRYQREGLQPYTWSNGPGYRYVAHSHDYDKVLYVVRGSITWILPDLGEEIETRPGDRINLPRGVRHAAQVGSQGVTCMEAHRL